MTYTAEQFVAANKTNVDALEGLAAQAYSGFEKLVEVNMAASKSILGDSFGHLQALLGAKDAQEMLALQTGLIKPLTEKSAAYGQQVYSLAAGTSSELMKAFESKAADAKTSFSKAVDDLVKSAPAGTETAVAAFKSAVAAGQSIIETAQNSAKKAMEVAEFNVTEAAEVVDVAPKASKKR
ncbi:phasin family protein [Rhodoferax sp.]|uniref:phasin family protein n=1 Tax=Rhodoferax sp. TaxID=50421 RepID=UPI0027620CB6|nr:phasin family protein [Rhodoferax sp.]